MKYFSALAMTRSYAEINNATHRNTACLTADIKDAAILSWGGKRNRCGLLQMCEKGIGLSGLWNLLEPL